MWHIKKKKKKTINEQSKQNKSQQKEILTCVDYFILGHKFGESKVYLD